MNTNQPKPPPRDVGPRWPDKLLMWLIAPHLREEVLGDLHERYHRRVQRLGERRGPTNALARGAGVCAALND